MRRFIIILSIELFTISYAISQTNPNSSSDKGGGEISGKVFDNSTKQPLQYTTIALTNKQTGKIVTGAEADAKGVFHISNIPFGIYRLDIQFIGYDKNTIDSININSYRRSITLGSIFLSSSTHNLQTVVVTADKPVVENKMDKIVYNVSNDITSQGGLAIDVLKKVPQVTVDIDGNVELQGNSNILFLINGKPSSAFGNSVTDALASIPASQIKSIEAITNPGAKYDSQGTGGIINIILQDNKMQGINCNINLSAGSRLENGSANVNYRHNNFGINAFFSGNAQLNSQVPSTQNRVSIDSTGKYLTTLSQIGTSGTERHGFRSGLGFDWTITKKDNLNGSIGYNLFNFRSTGLTNQEEVTQYIPTDSLSTINSSRYFYSRFTFKSLDLNLNYKKKFNKDGQELDLLYTSSNGRPYSYYNQTQIYKEDTIPFMGSASTNPGTDNENDFSVDYTHPFSATFTAEAGAKATFHNINSNTIGSVFSPSLIEFIHDPLQSYDLIYKMKIYAGYFSLNFKLFNYLNVKPGLRYEHTDINIDFPNTSIPSYGTFVPSVVLSHNFTKTTSLKLSYSKRIQRPDYRSLNPFVNISDPYNLTTGNPMLKPEIGNNFELGYNTGFKKGGNFYIALIERINNQDVTQFTTFYPTYLIGDSIYNNVSVTTSRNIGSEYNTGISASGSYPVTKKFNIRGNFMMTYRYIVSSITGDMATGLRTRLNLNLTYQLPKDLVVEIFGMYNAPSRNVQGKVPQFFFYNFAFRKLFWNKNASFGFTTVNPFSQYVKQVTTITATDYSSSSLRLMPLRSFGVSFTYKFGKLEFSKNKEEENNFLNQQDNP